MYPTEDIIDWNYCLKLSNNKPELAKELLTLFANDLPQRRDAILQAYHEQNIPKLLDEIHTLHGACCYCGVPQLKMLVEQLETDLKLHPNLNQLDMRIKTLDDVIQLVIEALKEYDGQQHNEREYRQQRRS